MTHGTARPSRDGRDERSAFRRQLDGRRLGDVSTGLGRTPAADYPVEIWHGETVEDLETYPTAGNVFEVLLEERTFTRTTGVSTFTPTALGSLGGPMVVKAYSEVGFLAQGTAVRLFYNQKKNRWWIVGPTSSGAPVSDSFEILITTTAVGFTSGAADFTPAAGTGKTLVDIQGGGGNGPILEVKKSFRADITLTLHADSNIFAGAATQHTWNANGTGTELIPACYGWHYGIGPVSDLISTHTGTRTRSLTALGTVSLNCQTAQTLGGAPGVQMQWTGRITFRETS